MKLKQIVKEKEMAILLYIILLRRFLSMFYKIDVVLTYENYITAVFKFIVRGVSTYTEFFCHRTPSDNISFFICQYMRLGGEWASQQTRWAFRTILISA